jgi:hypothetical protein
MTSAPPQKPLEAGSAVLRSTLSCFLCGRRIKALASASTREFLLKLKRAEVAFLTCADCFEEVGAEIAKQRAGIGA